VNFFLTSSGSASVTGSCTSGSHGGTWPTTGMNGNIGFFSNLPGGSSSAQVVPTGTGTIYMCLELRTSGQSTSVNSYTVTLLGVSETCNTTSTGSGATDCFMLFGVTVPTGCNTYPIMISPDVTGTQTTGNQIHHIANLNYNNGVCFGTTTTTHSSQTGTVSPGTPVTDTATVTSNGGTPTGTVQFYFCGPTGSATPCTISPGNAVGSPVALSGGSATSASESPVVPGFYCWSANYVATSGSGFGTSQSTSTTNECFQVFNGPPPPQVPEFPVGMLPLLLLAIPIMVLLKRKLVSPTLGRFF